MPKFENSPPPSDYEEDDIPPVFFTYPRPQHVVGVNFISIDRNLIHPSLLGLKRENNLEAKNESKTDEVCQNAAKDISKNENLCVEENVNVLDNNKLIAENKKICDNEMDASKEEEHKEAETCFKEEEKSIKTSKKD